VRKRNHPVSIWLSDSEHDHLKEQAELAGLPVDPFVRALIQGVNLRPRPPDTYPALLRELSAIGNNANQIAHIANGRKDISPEEVAEALRLIRQAWRLVKDAF